jgi:hypothetical protein
MRYEPDANERAPPRATRAGIALHPPVSNLQVGDCGAATSRQNAELDTWEDEGGSPLGRAPGDPGRQVDSQVDRHVKQRCDEFSG